MIRAEWRELCGPDLMIDLQRLSVHEGSGCLSASLWNVPTESHERRYFTGKSLRHSIWLSIVRKGRWTDT